MSHELTIRKDNFAEMAYVGNEPWHGLGQRLEAGASIDTWKEAAGMDWKIGRSRVRFGADDNPQMFEKHHVLFRSDTKEPLSIVGKDYKVTQPGEVLEFFRDLTESSGFSLDTAGTLFGGKQFWALASIGESAVIAGDDKVDGYLLLVSSCDGSTKTTAKFVAERVVCKNTLSMAMAEKSGRAVVKASHRSIFNPVSMKDQLGIAQNSWGAFIDYSRNLSKISVNTPAAESFIQQLLADSMVAVGKDVRKSKHFIQIMDLFGGSAMGGTLLGTEGTAWGLVNAVTEYVDHHKKAKSRNHQLSSAWFGAGDTLKTLAFERASEFTF